MSTDTPDTTTEYAATDHTGVRSPPTSATGGPPGRPARFLIGISVVAGVLIGLRLLLDAAGWWSGDPGTLTARIGVGLAVILAVIVWWKMRRRKK